MELTDLVHTAEPVASFYARIVALVLRPVFKICRAALHEPLVHFLIAGAIVLGLSAWLRETPISGGRPRIDVPAETVQQLVDAWTTRWGFPPDVRQTNGLVEDFIREEVFYREAMSSGLDRGDTLIREHLRQKMEYLAQGSAGLLEPTLPELEAFFDHHRDGYAVEDQVGFRQLYFSLDRHKERVEAVARATLAGLNNQAIPLDKIRRSGDASMLQYEFPPQTRASIRDLFGHEFATRVFDVTSGRWEGPIESSFGWHLVKVVTRVPGRIPDFNDIKERVVADFLEDRRRRAADAYYSKLRSRYQVDVDLGARVETDRAE